MPASLALVAVGGYGRGELYPASDVDLLILLPSKPGSVLTAQLERLVCLLWDIGLETGHSVRTIEQCLEEAAGDITVQTAMIEARLLTGSALLFRGLLRAAQGQSRRTRLLPDQAHGAGGPPSALQRHPCSLEANCKDGPGGLRDLQLILWIAQAAGYGKCWRISSSAASSPTRRNSFSKPARPSCAAAHAPAPARRAPRRSPALRVPDGAGRTTRFHRHRHRRSSEQLMQQYYRTAKTVTQINAILLQNIGAALFPPPDEPPQPINERFQNAHEFLDVVARGCFQPNPGGHPRGLSAAPATCRTEGHERAHAARAVARAQADRRRFPPQSGNRTRFPAIFKQERRLVQEFRRMNQFGVLGRYLPVSDASSARCSTTCSTSTPSTSTSCRWCATAPLLDGRVRARVSRSAVA
jgi:[protein-PII] uridylyltransferase